MEVREEWEWVQEVFLDPETLLLFILSLNILLFYLYIERWKRKY